MLAYPHWVERAASSTAPQTTPLAQQILDRLAFPVRVLDLLDSIVVEQGVAPSHVLLALDTLVQQGYIHLDAPAAAMSAAPDSETRHDTHSQKPQGEQPSRHERALGATGTADLTDGFTGDLADVLGQDPDQSDQNTDGEHIVTDDQQTDGRPVDIINPAAFDQSEKYEQHQDEHDCRAHGSHTTGSPPSPSGLGGEGSGSDVQLDLHPDLQPEPNHEPILVHENASFGMGASDDSLIDDISMDHRTMGDKIDAANMPENLVNQEAQEAEKHEYPDGGNQVASQDARQSSGQDRESNKKTAPITMTQAERSSLMAAMAGAANPHGLVAAMDDRSVETSDVGDFGNLMESLAGTGEVRAAPRQAHSSEGRGQARAKSASDVVNRARRALENQHGFLATQRQGRDLVKEKWREDRNQKNKAKAAEEERAIIERANDLLMASGSIGGVAARLARIRAEQKKRRGD